MKEVIVTLPNKPGNVHVVSKLLGQNHVNIRAVACIAQGDMADVHLLLEKPDDGEQILRDNDFQVSTGDVLLLEMEHSPGELARVTGLLSDAGVNVNLLYGSGSTGPAAQLVVGVDDIAGAREALLIDGD